MLVNFVSAFLLLATAINALIIFSPPSGSVIVSGRYVLLNVGLNGDTGVSSALVTFTGQFGAYASTVIGVSSFNQNIPFLLPASFSSGSATVTASGFSSLGQPAGTIARNFVTIVSGYTPSIPCYDPCYRPCYNPCYNPCRKPVCRKRVCKIPSTVDRCRIYGESSSEDQSNNFFENLIDFCEQAQQFALYQGDAQLYEFDQSQEQSA